MNNQVSYKIENVFNVFSTSINIDDYCYLNQIHSTNVLDVDDNYINGSNGDAMITKLVKRPLVIRTADCLPILLYDNTNKVLALVHSGWKGTLNNIIGETVKKMIKDYHSSVNDLGAYIYPGIRKCHFEVEEDVYDMFKNIIKNIDKYVLKKDNKYFIDLVSIIKDNLLELGVKNINDMGICTYCNHDKFYSYRYNHTDSRNYLIAMIEE